MKFICVFNWKYLKKSKLNWAFSVYTTEPLTAVWSHYGFRFLFEIFSILLQICIYLWCSVLKFRNEDQATGRYGTVPNRLWLFQSWKLIFTLLRFLHSNLLPNWLNSKSENCTELNAKKCGEKTAENILNFWTAENWNIKKYPTKRKKVLRKNFWYWIILFWTERKKYL